MGPTTDHAILEQPPNTHKNNGLNNGIKSAVQKIIDSHGAISIVITQVFKGQHQNTVLQHWYETVSDSGGTTSTRV